MGSESVRNGVLIATDRRLVLFAKKLTGYELESFPYGNISSFEQGKNMMGHNIRFFASGNRAEMKWIKTDTELATFTQTVKAAMNAKHSGWSTSATGQPPPAAQTDVMEQLRKLGELRDAGVVTAEEFEAKKAVLLDRL